jgi:TMEM175 potassium channel family protein
VTQPAAAGSSRWDTDRLEAFSDGVMAVIITIMAFGLEVPSGTSWHDLWTRLPDLLIYALSFIVIGIYWNNHHHLFRATDRISGGVMWANLHLLFWLSLIPLLTKWIGTDNGYRAHLPASSYGVAALGSAAAYGILVRAIIRANGKDSAVAAAIGSDLKGNISIGLNVLGVGLAWVSPWIAYGLYVAVALLWFVPDRRFTRARA